MKKSVQLPIIDPLYSTYHYQGSGCGIIEKNPSIRNWYLSEILMLTCSNQFLRDFPDPCVTVQNSSCSQNPYFERKFIPTKDAGRSLHSTIRSLIDEGYYINFLSVDDYYVEGKSWYKERHFYHDGLICGYDQNDRTYSIFAYDKNWRYCVFKTPQRCLTAGRRSAERKGMYGVWIASRPKEEFVEFNHERALYNIREYLDSSFTKYPPDVDGFVCGSIVHDYVAMYLNCLIEEKIKYDQMDRRVFRMIWEHKRVMHETMAKIEDTLGLDKELSDKYGGVVDMANRMRMMYASHHMKRRDSILRVIISLLLETKNTEVEILSALCEKAEGVIKT